MDHTTDDRDNIPTRIALVEAAIVEIKESLKSIENRMNRLEARMDALSDKFDVQFRWMIGTIIVMQSLTIAVIFKVVH